MRCAPRWAPGVHTPNTAPAGSATIAIRPPSRLPKGSATRLPPAFTALAATASASSTHTYVAHAGGIRRAGASGSRPRRSRAAGTSSSACPSLYRAGCPSPPPSRTRRHRYVAAVWGLPARPRPSRGHRARTASRSVKVAPSSATTSGPLRGARQGRPPPTPRRAAWTRRRPPGPRRRPASGFVPTPPVTMPHATNPRVPLTIGTNPCFAQPAKSPAELSPTTSGRGACHLPPDGRRQSAGRAGGNVPGCARRLSSGELVGICGLGGVPLVASWPCGQNFSL